MQRRTFLQRSIAAAATLGVTQVFPSETRHSLTAGAAARLEQFVAAQMAARHIPGLSACLIHEDAVLWQKSFGFADLKNKTPFTADHIQNIASISKTFTMLAVVQQVEAGLMSLDADINDYLPFSLRHPKFPDRPITPRLLLRHRSSLRDGSVYARHYACGDPQMSLGVWVRQLFETGADFYDESENFTPWGPGDQYEYTNTTYGVLGYLVELTSGVSFPEYCQRNIFGPLKMNNTGWLLANVDMNKHVVPYTWVADATVRGSSWGGVPLGVIRPGGATLGEPLANGFHENCAYNHPNYPDGFLRTSVNQLMSWARLWLNDGELDGVRLVSSETVQRMFASDNIADGGNAAVDELTWHSGHELSGYLLWGHGGSDPGVGTDLLMLREKRLAAIVFANTDGISAGDFAIEILREGLAGL